MAEKSYTWDLTLLVVVVPVKYSNVFGLIASQIFSLQEVWEVFLLSSGAFGVANSLNVFLYHSQCHSLYVQTDLIQIIL
jgi:hypothetical protein